MAVPDLSFAPSLSLSPSTAVPVAQGPLQANAVVDRQRVEIGPADQVVLVIGTVSFYNTGDTALDDVTLVVPRVEGIRPVNRADIEEPTRYIYRVGRLEPKVIRTVRVQWWVQRPARYSVPLVVQARAMTDILLPAVTFEGVAAAATPAPTVTPRTASPRPTVAGSAAPKGPLLWQATLDTSGSAIKSRTFEPAGATHQVRALAGAIEVDVQGTGGAFVVLTLDQPQPKNFYLELDVQADRLLMVEVGSDANCRYSLAVNGTTRSIYVWRERSGTVFCENALLTQSVQSPDLAVGRRVTAGIAVTPTSYDLYLSGRLVDRAPVATAASTAIAFRTRGAPALFRIEGVRLHSLGP